MPASLRSGVLLDVVSNYACAGLGRAPRIHGALSRFASKPREITGLVIDDASEFVGVGVLEVAAVDLEVGGLGVR